MKDRKAAPQFELLWPCLLKKKKLMIKTKERYSKNNSNRTIRISYMQSERVNNRRWIERKTGNSEIEEGIRKKYWRAGASPFEKKIDISLDIDPRGINFATHFPSPRIRSPPFPRPAFPSTTTTTISELINSGHNDVYGTRRSFNDRRWNGTSITPNNPNSSS